MGMKYYFICRSPVVRERWHVGVTPLLLARPTQTGHFSLASSDMLNFPEDFPRSFAIWCKWNSMETHSAVVCAAVFHFATPTELRRIFFARLKIYSNYAYSISNANSNVMRFSTARVFTLVRVYEIGISRHCSQVKTWAGRAWKVQCRAKHHQQQQQQMSNNIMAHFVAAHHRNGVKKKKQSTVYGSTNAGPIRSLFVCFQHGTRCNGTGTWDDGLVKWAARCSYEWHWKCGGEKRHNLENVLGSVLCGERDKHWNHICARRCNRKVAKEANDKMCTTAIYLGIMWNFYAHSWHSSDRSRSDTMHVLNDVILK